MTALPTTQKELVLVQRDAAARFVVARFAIDPDKAAQKAAEFFPLPSITVTREVSDKTGNLWKFENAQLWVQQPATAYIPVKDINVWLGIAGASEAISNVLHQPTQTVEEAA
jgi:hypothetical protein